MIPVVSNVISNGINSMVQISIQSPLDLEAYPKTVIEIKFSKRPNNVPKQ